METAELTKQTSPADLLQLAIEKGADLGQLEKLMDLHDRWQKGKAKKQFLEAISEFQSRCPDLKKKKSVSFGQGKAAYKYTPLGEIALQVKDILKECGLSYRWELEEKDKSIHCTCIVSHKEGHSERTTMNAGLDTSGNKNEIQQRGSTVTYLQRYTLVAALGISTADEDNDGKTTATAKNEKDTGISDEDTGVIKNDLRLCKTESEVITFAEQWKQYHRNTAFRKMCQERIAELKSKKK